MTVFSCEICSMKVSIPFDVLDTWRIQLCAKSGENPLFEAFLVL